MQQRVRLKDIARETGLSIAAVSLILNRKPVRVSEEKRALVLDLAERLHYVPNQIARSLVTQQSYTLGVIVPNIESRFFSSLAKQLEITCRKEGYGLFITNSDENPHHDSQFVSLLAQRGVDGLFIITSSEGEESADLKLALEQQSIPYVLVDRVIPGLVADRVSFDNKVGGYIATKHLLANHHKRIACILNLEALTGKQRLVGYQQALAEAGIAYDESLVIHSRYNIACAYEAAHALAKLSPTAVFASSDNIALGLMRYFYEQRISVPDACSVVSYDNSAADALFEPALTAVEQSVSALATAAFELLSRRIHERKCDARRSADTCTDTHTQETPDVEIHAAASSTSDSSRLRLLDPVLVVKHSVREL